MDAELEEGVAPPRRPLRARERALGPQSDARARARCGVLLRRLLYKGHTADSPLTVACRARPGRAGPRAPDRARERTCIISSRTVRARRGANRYHSGSQKEGGPPPAALPRSSAPAARAATRTSQGGE